MKKWVSVVTVVCVICLTMLGGCALFGNKPTPEELVMQQVQALTNDLLAGKADTVLNYVSADFYHPDVGGKDKLAGYIEQGKQMGYVEQWPQLVKEHEGKVVLDHAQVKVTGDTATVYPIEASSVDGSVTVELSFKKDPDGVWRVCGANIEGL